MWSKLLAEISDCWSKSILLKPDSRLVAIHEGKYYKADQQPALSLGPGCFVRGLEYAANCKATVVGKPNAYFFQSALPAGVEMDECLMIGDVCALLLGHASQGTQFVRS